MNPPLLHESEIESLLEKNAAALALEHSFPRSVRTTILHSVGFGIAIILFILGGLFIIGNTLGNVIQTVDLLSFFSENTLLMIGLASLFSALWLVLFALELFSLSNHFGGLKSSFSRTDLYRRPDGLSFELLSLLYEYRDEDNLSVIAFSSKHARILFTRLGFDVDESIQWFKDEHTSVEKAFPLRGDGKMLLVSDIITLVYKSNSEIQAYFFERGVTEQLFFGALDWTERIFRMGEKSLRAWSRINLSEIPGIAKDWSYGGAYTLRRYAREVYPAKNASLVTRHAEDATETILSKSHEANALLVGERGVTRDSVKTLLAERIKLGNANSDLEGKLVFLLDPVALASRNPDKASYEEELIGLLSDSAEAGNIILVIENIADLFRNADGFGVDISEIFDPYLQSDSLQVIASATPEEKATTLARFPFIQDRFETVIVDSVHGDDLVITLSYRALLIEARSRRQHALFTFQAVARAAELARSVLAGATLPDGAIDILESAYAEAQRQGRTIITTGIIDEIVTARTGVPVGVATREEKQELLTLEDTLSEMVVGQEDALRAVANALRRSRSGIKSTSRPTGSFLFLGPTGVGKTQVARALERALFRRTDAMNRLDMSEFSGARALERLIGSTGSDKQGILEEKVTRAPYGILLLDEFEKASSDVHNLFLQILEEGFYSNARGKRVSLRNLVIIATSNAGSREIQKATLEHKNLAWFKKELIARLIEGNVFRPELLNRFDDIILFEPLSKESLYTIAKLELEKLSERVKNTGVHIEITEELLNFLVSHGYEPEFGARPMKRVLEQTVERVLSEKILKGEVTPGSTVSFSLSELENLL